MLKPRPSSRVAPSIWKLEVETPQMRLLGHVAVVHAGSIDCLFAVPAFMFMSVNQRPPLSCWASSGMLDLAQCLWWVDTLLLLGDRGRDLTPSLAAADRTSG